jgi:hypothetical protein
VQLRKFYLLFNLPSKLAPLVNKEFEMKKLTFISLLFLVLFAVTRHVSVAVPEPDLDLQSLIAGIKQFDAAVTSGKGEFVYDHKIGPFEDKREYAFAFEGGTFEEGQLRVDYSKCPILGSILTEIYDGERQWEVNEKKGILFSVDISTADMELLNKATPVLPPPVKQQLKAHDIYISDDFRIVIDEESSYLKVIDNVTGHSCYAYYTEEYFAVYTPRLEYSARSRCFIHSHLDPRYWMTYGFASPTHYLMTPLWEILETHESEILQTEMLNGEETYLVSVKYPHTKSLKLWISPEKGFRLVKLQKIFESQDEPDQWNPFEKGVHYVTERVLHYWEYLPGIWFPEKIKETIHPLVAADQQKRGALLGKTTLQAITCELNTDVSNRFQLDVPGETPVYDYGLDKLCPLRELRDVSR